VTEGYATPTPPIRASRSAPDGHLLACWNTPSGGHRVGPHPAGGRPRTAGGRAQRPSTRQSQPPTSPPTMP